MHPELNGKPVVVLSNNDGCIVARSDEVKKLGIPMGAPMFKYRNVIERNNVHVFSGNLMYYNEVSRNVMQCIRQFAPEVQVYSVDEAFIDFDGFERFFDLVAYSKKIREAVMQQTGIPVSIGIAATKTLAKVANKVAKKNASYEGVCLISKSDELAMALDMVQVEDVWGVGRKNAAKLRFNGIGTALELSRISLAWAQKHLGGVVGMRLLYELNGKSCISVEQTPTEQQLLTYSRSFGKEIKDLSELKEAVAYFTTRASERMRRKQLAARRMLVFAITNRFKENYHSVSKEIRLDPAISATNLLLVKANEILDEIFIHGLAYKKAGVLFLDLVPETGIQYSLFDHSVTPKKINLMKAVDGINRKMGRDKVFFAASGIKQQWKPKSELKSSVSKDKMLQDVDYLEGASIRFTQM